MRDSADRDWPGNGLAIVQSNRPEQLRQVVLDHMRRFPLAPLENEVVLTQSNGIGRWLQLAMAETPGEDQFSGGLGIGAAVRSELPARFLWDAYRIVLGDERLPEKSLFDANRLRWLVHRSLEKHLNRPGFGPLRNFLAVEPDNPRRRFQLACALADLFESYQFFRADWLADWESGRERLKAGSQVQSLPEDQAWQPELWRALVEAGGAADARHRGRLHGEFLSALDQPAGSHPRLPRRIIVFGISSLPEQTLRALAALGGHSQVLVCLLNPCGYYWGNLVEARDDFRRWNPRYKTRRNEQGREMPAVALSDAEFTQWGNPLLASWGRQGRDFIEMLDEMDRPEEYRSWFDDRIDLFDDFAPEPNDRLLRQLQQGILDLDPVPSRQNRKPVAPNDDSIRFTIAHSRQREVEILHDHLLAAFDNDATLQPREVIVMVPDIDAYAPHIESVFGNLASIGSGEHADPRFIPFTIGDRNARLQSGFMRAVEDLLTLPTSRFTTTDVLDLLQVPALRQRFGFDETDLEKITDWSVGAGVRWGLDVDHRRQILDDERGFAQNSWSFGLDRMLLGYTTGRGEVFADILPYDEVTPSSADLAGRLAAMIKRLDHWREKLSSPAAPRDWAQRLHDMIDGCFAPVGSDDTLDRFQFDQALEALVEDTELAGFDDNLPLDVIRECLLAELDRNSVSKRFLAGCVNFTTLMPMRAIPFRIVCMLGMNDGDYPRTRKPADFDLMEQHRRRGDRSRREDDRYLFLEALLSARDHLYVSWVGRNIRDNSAIPPSVLVGQLRDTIAAGWVPEGAAEQDDENQPLPDAGSRLVDRLTTSHPLQPFSPAYFDVAQDDLKTYAREWGEAWQQLEQAQAASGPLPIEWPEGGLSLRDLEDFFRNPAGAFMPRRLGAYPKKAADLDPPPVDEAFELDKLENWQLTNELLQRLMRADVPPDEQRQEEQSLEEIFEKQLRIVRMEGRLPLKSFGKKIEEEALEKAIEIGKHWFSELEGFPVLGNPVRIQIRLPVSGEDDLRTVLLEDWLGDVRHSPEGAVARVHLLASKLQSSKAAKVTRANAAWDKLAGYWPAHLAACAMGLELTTVIIGADNRAQFDPLPADVARRQLESLVEHWIAGMSKPMPVLPALSGEYVRKLEENREKEENDWLEGMRETLRRKYEEKGYGENAPPPLRDRNVEIARFYPDFRAMWEAPEDDGFRIWSERLYRPLVLSQPEKGKR